MSIPVGKKADLPPGKMKLVQAGGKMLCLANAGGTLYAIDELCPHRAGPLSEGTLNGTLVSCPWHGAQFDLKTGEKTAGPSPRGVKCYPVHVAGEEILVDI